MAALLPGTFNSRELGGLRTPAGAVRAGSIVRSDAPVNLGEAGRQALRQLGVRTAVDLRQPIERQLDPADLDGLGIELVHVPILGEEFERVVSLSLRDIYLALLERRGEAFAAALAPLARPGATPALYFCSAGKDRTGLLSALLLGVLGVGEEDIVADYHQTEQNLSGLFRERLERRALAAGVSQQEIAVKLGAPRELMVGALAWLRVHHGGAAGYLRAHGCSERSLERMRAALVVPRAQAA